jgi:outer membrane protein OmpA-like peptidoglycan-associated protein
VKERLVRVGVIAGAIVMATLPSASRPSRKSSAAAQPSRAVASAPEPIGIEQSLPKTEVSRELARARDRLSGTEARLRKSRDELAVGNALRAEVETKTRLALDQLAAAARVWVTDESRGTVIVVASQELFAFHESRLLVDSEARLGPIAEALSQVREHRIRIEDHSSAHGTDESSSELSQARAETVRDFFVSRGIPAGRVTATGSGARFRADSAGPTGTARGRRVEIVVESMRSP